MDWSIFSFLAPAIVASLIIAGIHAYLGLHVVERGVIFVDLSLAQIASLGAAIAVWQGYDAHAPAIYWMSLGFTFLGAAIFSAVRLHKSKIPQEAIIGIVYVVASAAALLVADKAPRGGEAIKDILVGSLLWVGWPAIWRLAVVYAAIGAFHWVLRRRFLTISFEPDSAVAQGWRVRWWDFLFYLSFGIVITFSVPVVGVLLVFSFLVIPAAIAFQFTRRRGLLAVYSWLAGVLASAGGLWVSFHYDLPTGPVVVCVFGVLLLLAYLVRRMTGHAMEAAG